MPEIRIGIFRSGTLLGMRTLTILESTDGRHVAEWRRNIYPVTQSESGLVVDISGPRVVADDCVTCTHHDKEILWDPPSDPEGIIQKGSFSTVTPGEGGLLLDELKRLVLRAMAGVPECLPDGEGLPYSHIETLAGLGLDLPKQDRWITWSILSFLNLYGDTQQSKKSKKGPILWRLTDQGKNRAMSSISI